MGQSCLTHETFIIKAYGTKRGNLTLRAKTLTPDLWQSGASHGDDVLLPLRQDDDIIDGPLVVALAGVERLPPAEPGGRSLGGQRKLVVDEAEKIEEGNKFTITSTSCRPKQNPLTVLTAAW